MNATDQESKTLAPMFYPARLAEWELEKLVSAAEYCLVFHPRSKRLAHYLARVVTLEGERRKAEEAGDEVLEVAMSPLTCESWTNAELVAAMLKTSALMNDTNGEVRELLTKLHLVFECEACYRLDPQNLAGIGKTED